MGALREWVTGQMLDKGWTNVQGLSKVCTRFFQTLSMSTFCQIIHTFLDKCQCFVQGLSKVCQIFATLSNQFYTGQNLRKLMSIVCPILVQGKSFNQAIQGCQVYIQKLSKYCPYQNLIQFFVDLAPYTELRKSPRTWL